MDARHPNGRGRDERHVCDECAHRIAQLEAQLAELKADVRLAVQALSDHA